LGMSCMVDAARAQNTTREPNTDTENVSGRWILQNDIGTATWDFTDADGVVVATGKVSSRDSKGAIRIGNYDCNGSRSKLRVDLACSYQYEGFSPMKANMILTIQDARTMIRE